MTSISKKILLRNGLKASFQQWGNPSSLKKVICIHGWLDNSNSFKFLGPYLADRGFHIVAYDNIGHGYSSYESGSSNNYTVGTFIGFCRELIDVLQWDQFNMVGHSLGASITSVFAATYPENVKRIALIDGFTTPVTIKAKKTVSNLRNSIDLMKKFNEKQLKRSGPKNYKTMQDAVAARIKSVSTFPGNQFLSEAAATLLVAR